MTSKHVPPTVLMDKHGVVEGNREPILALLSLLRYRHIPTYEHSIRVANLAATMAEHLAFPGVTPNMMVYAGLLHDVGKILIDPVLLSKDSFNEDDYLAMEHHSMYGYMMLRSIFDLTAHIVVRHHRYGSRPYPAVLPTLPSDLEREVEIITEASRLVALADFYDALTTRNNDHNTASNPTQRREVFIRENLYYNDLIRRLEELGILTYE
jgi:putative nucleotidyltransferase with HDIG domain